MSKGRKFVATCWEAIYQGTWECGLGTGCVGPNPSVPTPASCGTCGEMPLPSPAPLFPFVKCDGGASLSSVAGKIKVVSA